MPATIDPAILRALSLNASNVAMKTHGGSGFASTYRITTPSTSFFIKTSSSRDAHIMFEGEHASVNAIHDAVPSLCPMSFAHGKLDNGGYFLATEFVDFSAGGRQNRVRDSKGSGMSLAQKLARLYTTPAPVPDGYDRPMWGFPVSTCCGNTVQRNTFSNSWPEFFGQHRLMAILEKCEENNGKDVELRRIVERTVREVVPRLLGEGHLGGEDDVVPVVIHGDLWSGNKAVGVRTTRNEKGVVEELIFDSSASFSHHEMEHGIMNMFGGFGPAFWKEYHGILEKTKPASEYEDRVRLYEAYHHLNHHAIFGREYKSGAMSMLGQLINKYGEK